MKTRAALLVLLLAALPALAQRDGRHGFDFEVGTGRTWEVNWIATDTRIAAP